MLFLFIAEALLMIDVLKSCKKVVNQPIPLNKCLSTQGIGLQVELFLGKDDHVIFVHFLYKEGKSIFLSKGFLVLPKRL